MPCPADRRQTVRYHYAGGSDARKASADMAFGFMLPVLAGFIAMAIGDRPALAVGFVGGYDGSTAENPDSLERWWLDLPQAISSLD